MCKKLFLLLTCFFFIGPALQAATDEELIRLEADMLKYFSTNNIDTFFKVTNKLKEASKKKGMERLFYKAWANQAEFEGTKQNYKQAFDIADQIAEYASDEGSHYGLYAAMHAKAAILLQKQDYEAADKAYKEALEYRHKHFPTESAGEDLQELMKIANHMGDFKGSVKYARLILAEPNVAPIHKGRALYRISQMAFNKNNVEEFNHVYDEMMKLKETEGISTLKPIVEVNHYIINGEYEKALALSDELDDESCAERKAIIYHLMGDDADAYKYMQKYKQVSDSIVRVSHGNVVASCYVQMNNERLQKEQQLLEKQNESLQYKLYAWIGASLVIILLVVIYKRHKVIRVLQGNHKKLIYENKDAVKALEDLAELSYYDMKTDLPLTSVIRPNEFCKSLTVMAQSRCQKGVTMIYKTEVPDDFEIRTNHDALEKMIEHLLDNMARSNDKGMIILACSEKGDNVKFSVADTTPSRDDKFKNRFIGMFTEKDNKLHYVGMTYKICQSITRLLKGRIRFDIEYMEGTSLSFEIPKNNRRWDD